MKITPSISILSAITAPNNDCRPGDVAITLPPSLAAIAAGRDHITTAEFGSVVSRSMQTIRKNYCLAGECYGIRPAKVGMRLLWPVTAIAALLQGKGVGQ